MDTKWKRYKYALAFKIVAWVLCIASMCGLLYAMRAMSGLSLYRATPDYIDSFEFTGEMGQWAEEVWTATMPVDEDVLKLQVDDYVTSLREQRRVDLENLSALESVEDVYAYDAVESFSIAPGATAEDVSVAYSAAASETTVEAAAVIEDNATDDAVESYRRKRINEINAKYDGMIENAEEHIRAENEKEMQSAQKALATEDEFYYAVIRDGVLLDTNVEEGGPMNTILSQDGKYLSEWAKEGYMQHETTGQHVPGVDGISDDTTAVYLAMKPDVFIARQDSYNQEYNLYGKNIVWVVICIVLGVFGFIWLMATAGRNDRDDEVRLLKTDEIYLDVGFVLLIIALIVLLTFAYSTTGAFYAFFSTAYIDALSVVAVFATAAAGVTVVLLWAMSLARRAKLGNAGKHTLAYKVFGGIGKLFQSSGAKTQAVVGFVFYLLAGILCSAILVYGMFWWEPGWTLIGVILLIVYGFVSLMVSLKRTRALDAIRVGVEEIKNGNMDYMIPVYDDSQMGNIAKGINNMAEGLSSAVKKEVKAERMKTELITNISHDLKTPLTSILTYVDLLKKQGGLSGEAKKYLDVLDTKSNRLKVLTDDLFEAAKASSGDIAVNITRIELVQFMEQAIGEMSDRMDESGLAFITELPDDKMFVCADGKLLFRVVSNVFDNVIKYALEGSRVYVSMTCDEENICVIVKNISKDELNITEAELMERFVRGDSSRNTEGSGLGLAIAKDFMRLMNGQFIIEIDGDLFKVNICLKKAM